MTCQVRHPRRETGYEPGVNITRRHALAAAALSAGAAATTVAATGLRWWDQPAGEGYKCLSDDEAAFIRALAAAAWPATEAIPHSGGDLDLDRYLDDSLSVMSETSRTLLKMLFNMLDTWPMPRHMSSFAALVPAERAEVLEHWLGHFRAEVRQAAQSLVLMIGMGYTTHPKVAPFFQNLHSCGYGR